MERKKKKPTHGGKREGSGRKPQYGEPTVTISFRVPESKATEVKKHIGVLLKGWEIGPSPK